MAYNNVGSLRKKKTMSYDGVYQMDYMVDEGDVADPVDGIDEEYHTADDANLDEYDMVSHVSIWTFVLSPDFFLNLVVGTHSR